MENKIYCIYTFLTHKAIFFSKSLPRVCVISTGYPLNFGNFGLDILILYIEDITRWREHKIHIFEPTCNVLFITWRLYSKQQTRREKPIQQKQKAGIVISLNDTTLTKVTYGKYATRVPDEGAHNDRA